MIRKIIKEVDLLVKKDCIINSTGILKIRVGWVLEAMKHYLDIIGSKKKLEDHSPFEIRLLVFKILSIKDWDSYESTKLERVLTFFKINYNLKF